MSRLFVDLDGVLADFDQHHENVFGVRSNKYAKPGDPDDVDWQRVANAPDFYRALPKMRDADDLWAMLEPMHPTILTGIPRSVAEAEQNKRDWVLRHIGPVPVICCRSSEKYEHCNPGDLLIDDWDKYRDRWCAKGGLWIRHTSAVATIQSLFALQIDYGWRAII